ncbi:MAG TPA: PEP-CTERM sorting domain-containing protein [Myxococcales bacterium]|nr:PEP-CTERM sorting domain-containing protein [Myxococcales bacterium]HIL80209.1 PEP-CTERM sorting domain-containing protein [Myxococcales bacterium]
MLEGEHPMIKFFITALCALAITFSGVARAAITEDGDLNFISGTGTASDGLAFLDMSFSVGLSLDGALDNARLTYVDARLATASEFDDLFLAAGVVYAGLMTASDGFGAGGTSFLALEDGGVTLLNAALGSTSSALSATLVWTDPDGIGAISSTRDYLSMDLGGTSLVQNTLAVVPNSTLGWLLVVDSRISPVPEPSTGLLLSLGILGLGISRRRVAVRLNTRQ